MESFASRDRWLPMKVKAALGWCWHASKLEGFFFWFLSVWYWISAWSLTSEPETTSFQSKCREDWLCKTLPLVFTRCLSNGGSVTVGAATRHYAQKKKTETKAIARSYTPRLLQCGQFCQNWPGFPYYILYFLIYRKEKRKKYTEVSLNTAAHHNLHCQQPAQP